MIKFFRKTRQNLINEGKTAKYVKYAIGEIILVVFGILIALQINNWNENRKMNHQKNSYLKRLIQENKEDLVTFTNEIERLHNNNTIIVNLSNAFKDKNCSDSLLVKSANNYLIFGTLYPTVIPSTSTFEDLSNTGNLSVIKNTELRDQIVSHYKNYEFMKWTFKIDSDWAIPIDAALFTDTDALRFDSNKTSFLFPDASIEMQAKELREEQAIYTRNAAIHYWINDHCINYLKKVKEETLDFIGLLEKANKNERLTKND